MAPASSPYGPYGQTGPYNQKNDPWNTRRPPTWKPFGFTGGDTNAILSNPQVQRITSMLRGPDGEPLEEPPPPPPARFGGGSGGAMNGRASMDALLAHGNDPNSLKDNMATGADVIKQRRAQMRNDYWTKPRAVGGPDFGESYGMGYQNDGTPWGDFFQALAGKEANTGIASGGKQQMRVGWGGFGRSKAYDPAISQMYDLESGEQPPGEYSPGQMDYIGRSQPAMNALRRAVGLPGVLV